MVWGVYPQLGSLEQVKADLDALSALDLTPLDAPATHERILSAIDAIRGNGNGSN